MARREVARGEGSDLIIFLRYISPEVVCHFYQHLSQFLGILVDEYYTIPANRIIYVKGIL